MDKGRIDLPTLELSFSEYMDLVKVVKMLYGREIAEKFFTKGLAQLYNIDSASITKLFEKG